MTQIYSGDILFEGRNIRGLQTHEITKLGMAYLPQVNNVFSNLTVKENLTMAGYTLGKDEARERVEEVLEEFPILKEYIDRKANTLSGGERQMLAMAMAIMRRPKFMLFDEPTGNLAPKIALQVLNKIVTLRDEYGMSIILVEQNAKRALKIGDKAVLLISGRVMYDGEAKELLSHPELGQVYLGVKKA